MGKRNVRIGRKLLPERLHELPGKQIHVVLLDGSTHFGECLKADTVGIQVRDAHGAWTSKKRHTHLLPLEDIVEVIYDLISEY